MQLLVGLKHVLIVLTIQLVDAGRGENVQASLRSRIWVPVSLTITVTTRGCAPWRQRVTEASCTLLTKADVKPAAVCPKDEGSES